MVTITFFVSFGLFIAVDKQIKKRFKYQRVLLKLLKIDGKFFIIMSQQKFRSVYCML